MRSAVKMARRSFAGCNTGATEKRNIDCVGDGNHAYLYGGRARPGEQTSQTLDHTQVAIGMGEVGQ